MRSNVSLTYRGRPRISTFPFSATRNNWLGQGSRGVGMRTKLEEMESFKPELKLGGEGSAV